MRDECRRALGCDPERRLMMSGQTECPSLEMLRLYLSGCIADSAATPIHQHLTHCSACVSSVETISQSARPTEQPLSAPGGTHIAFGRYQVRGLLGRGGMGAVYEGFDPQLHRAVAIKVPSFGGTSEEQTLARKRFLREAQAAAQVRHPNVCATHDVGEQDDNPFVVMDLS